MRHHTADTTDGMLSLGKDDMVSTIVVGCVVSNLMPCKKELKSLGSCLCIKAAVNREKLYQCTFDNYSFTLINMINPQQMKNMFSSLCSY
jgi:hypothetical protein